MNEPDYYWNRPLPTPEEFECLADEILDPLLKQFGYASGPRERHPLFVCMYYRDGARTLKVYYEAREAYVDIRYQGPGMDGLHNILFICKRLGRPYEDYKTAAGSLRERIDVLSRLLQEQLTDVLTGKTAFQFSEADAQEVLAHWEAKKREFLTLLFERLKPLGFTEKRHSGLRMDRHSILRPTPSGHHSFDLSTGTRLFGLSIDPYVKIRHDAVETLFHEMHRLATKGKPIWKPDTSTIHVGLYALEGKKNRYLSIESDDEFDAILNQLYDDFVRLGAPFLEQAASLEGAYRILRDGLGIAWAFERFDIGCMQRALCLACLLEQYRDVPNLIKGVKDANSSGPYGPNLFAGFMTFVECLRSKYPDLPTTIH